jgi:uncharacterized protein YkwD
LSHTGKDGSTWVERCQNAGTYCSAENVAMNSNPSADSMMKQFKASTGHNKNMLNGTYTVVGIGYTNGYVTQIFR